ncbi:MAG: CoA-binding protein [Deltaproteobacteria bacterium]|nr:CoA-binding protein [Deltaproteobacteria bacterium]MBW2016766.1 CoA-binding protein [Deltaproteobacteria bacterium]MBW2129302.1 CoA-binding protein [Deltaproteobacteria bacterium]MBW2304207.1 CoA-binding protein [Deltaproteobacteria bacterium]
MLDRVEDSPLYPLANPRSIALFGASNRGDSMGTSHLLSLLHLGFEGPLYPIHPTEKQVLGIKAYRDPGELPEVPDLALLVLPTRVVPEVLEACGKSGIRHAIVVSGGFREVGGEGVLLERRLKEIAARYRIRFLGPNCIGVANPHHRLNTTFFQFDGRAGYVGLASQSGSFVTQMFKFLDNMELGFSTAFSVGNEADVDIVDAMEYLGACPRTKVIALYIEGITRGRYFLETARSIVPHKPIVAFYAGGSGAGKRASFSHTGAMAGSDRVYDGAFRQCGIIRASSVTELFDFCWVLATQPRPRGARVIIQTHSGGPGAAAADACDRSGLQIPNLSSETKERLAPFVPPTGSLSNPVDMTYHKDPTHYFEELPRILLEDEGADMLLVYFLLPTQLVEQTLGRMGVPRDRIREETNKFIDEHAKAICALPGAHRKPLVGYTFRDLKERFILRLRSGGIPVFPEPARAARAMRALVEYARACGH